MSEHVSSSFYTTTLSLSPPFSLKPLSHPQCYILHIIGASSEWLIAITMILFFLTFHPDFMRINVELQVKIRGHHSDVEGPMINEHTPLPL